MTERPPGRLEAVLRARRDNGQKLLVPYLMGGLGEEWPAVLEAVAAAGADAVEVGIAFSDPMIDGQTIQEASVRALAGGATPERVVASLASADVGGTPLVVMTYYNIIARAGEHRMAQSLAESGVSGAIVPDLPADEIDSWQAEAFAAGLDTVLLAAPTTPDARLKMIAGKASGFLYAVGVMGVTGERTKLAESALEIARRCKEASDLPVLVGVGVTTPEQAVTICRVADGVVVGSALVRRLLDGEGPDGAAELVGSFRKVLDAAFSTA